MMIEYPDADYDRGRLLWLLWCVTTYYECGLVTTTLIGNGLRVVSALDYSGALW